MFGFIFVPLVFLVAIVSLLAFFDAEFYTVYIHPINTWIDTQLQIIQTPQNKYTRTNSTPTKQHRRTASSKSSSHNSSRATSPSTLRRRALRRMHRQAKHQQSENNTSHNNELKDIWSEFTPLHPRKTHSYSASQSRSNSHKFISGVQYNDNVTNEYIERTKHSRSLTFDTQSSVTSPVHDITWKQYSQPIHTNINPYQNINNTVNSPSIPLHPHSRQAGTPVFVVNPSMNSVSPNPYYTHSTPRHSATHQYTSPVPITYSQSIPTQYTQHNIQQYGAVDYTNNVPQLQFNRSTPTIMAQYNTPTSTYDDKSMFHQSGSPTPYIDQTQVG